MTKLTKAQRSTAARKGWRTRKQYVFGRTGLSRCLRCGKWHLHGSKVGKAHAYIQGPKRRARS